MLRRYKYRGISTFVAVLLLMVLAVSAGAVIYAYTMGYLGGLGGTTTPGTLSLDSATGNATTDDIIAYVRNIGKGSLEIDDVYVDGTKIPDANVSFDPSATIAEGEVVKITIDCTNTVDLKSGKTYEVKIVATDGTHLTFSVKAD
jgi:FlaG/FlaF family flagellin (archaellin)